MDKESVVLGCGCEVFGDEAQELRQRFRLLRLLIVSTALSMPLLWDLPPRFQFVLATLLQFGPGLYFLQNAIRGLKNRSLGMDLLVALSTTAIYVYSTVVAFTETENIKLYYLCDGVLTLLLTWLLLGGSHHSMELGDSAGFGAAFLLGLMTSPHCLGMCGGILLGNCAQSHSPALASLAYNGGRILSYTAIGGIFGALGTVIAYSMSVKSMVFTMVGLVVILIGLNLWGLLPGLSVLIVSQPSFCQLPTKTRKRFAGRPLVIGLLTGLMPCASLYAMWLHAVSGGSAAYGAESMLAFALGTAPLLFLFGALGALIPKKWNKYFLKASAVLVTAMGMKMLITGLRML